MMEYHFIHALVVTPFESSLTPLDWDTLAQQDYPIHVLYCSNLGKIVFQSDNQKFACADFISFFKQSLEILSIPALYEQQIIILREDENEYSAADVMKHFSH